MRSPRSNPNHKGSSSSSNSSSSRRSRARLPGPSTTSRCAAAAAARSRPSRGRRSWRRWSRSGRGAGRSTIITHRRRSAPSPPYPRSTPIPARRCDEPRWLLLLLFYLYYCSAAARVFKLCVVLLYIKISRVCSHRTHPYYNSIYAAPPPAGYVRGLTEAVLSHMVILFINL